MLLLPQVTRAPAEPTTNRLYPNELQLAECYTLLNALGKRSMSFVHHYIMSYLLWLSVPSENLNASL